MLLKYYYRLKELMDFENGFKLVIVLLAGEYDSRNFLYFNNSIEYCQFKKTRIYVLFFFFLYSNTP